MNRAAKRRLWVRRVVSTTLVLAALALLVFGAVTFVQFLIGKYSVEQQERSSAVRPTPITILECTNQNLRVTTRAQPTDPGVGEGFDLDVRVRNKGKDACSLDTGALRISLVTGEDTVWEPTTCSSDWERQLLLSPKTDWEAELRWDGKVYDDCEPVKDPESGEDLVALDGTYRVEVTANGTRLPAPTVVQLIWK